MHLLIIDHKAKQFLTLLLT